MVRLERCWSLWTKLDSTYFLMGPWTPSFIFPPSTLASRDWEGRLVVICTQLWSNIYQIGLLTRNTSLLLLVRDKLTDVLARQPCRPSVKPNYISLTEFNYYNLEKVQSHQLQQPASDFDLVQYGFMLCCGSKPSNPFKTGNSKSSLHAQLVLWKLGRISSFIVMSFWRSPYTTWEKIEETVDISHHELSIKWEKYWNC